MIRPDFVNHRLAGESRKEYRARLRSVQRAINLHLKGRLRFKSTEPLTFPAIDINAEIDAMVTRDIDRGLIVGLRPVTLGQPLPPPFGPKDAKPATVLRVGRTKGVTYTHPSKETWPHFDRTARRIQLGGGAGWRDYKMAA